MIIDAHSHICPRVHGEIADGPTRGIGYGGVAMGDTVIQAWPPLCAETMHSPEMLIAHMDWVGVDKAVLLQGAFYGECNDYVADAAKRYPDRLIAAGYLDPWSDAAEATLDGLVEWEVFRALKLECSVPTGLLGLHPEARLDDPAIAWLWDRLEEAGLVLVLDLGSPGTRSYQTDAVRDIAAAHTALKIVIAHLGQPSPAIDTNETLRHQWEAQIDLGHLDNIWFDTASLPTLVSPEPYPYPTAGRFIRSAVDRIGARSLLWGSDIPGLLARATYAQLLESTRGHLDFLADDERADVLGENAERVFNA